MVFHTVICGALVCPPYSTCESAGICVCKKCSHDGKMVCGSDGKSYNDFCKLQKVACESNTFLRMVRKGPCQGRFPLLHFVSLHRSTFRGRGTAKETRNAIITKSRNKVSPEGFDGVSVSVMQGNLLFHFLS